MKKLSLLLCPLWFLFVSVTAGAERATSPDGKVVVTFALQNDGSPAWEVTYSGKPILLESRLGLEPAFTNTFTLVRTITNEHSGQWTNDFGELRIVPDRYRELAVDLKHRSGRLLRLTFRAYNEGAAFRYTFPREDTNEVRFSGEHTEFRFPDGAFGYEEHGTEGIYRRVKATEIQPWCERPLTLELPKGMYATLGEAGNSNYPRMLLSPLDGVPGALVSALGGTSANTEAFRQRHDPNFTLSPGDSSPWRVLIVGDKPGDLLERNYLMLNLNPPSALADTSWIVPGKVMRDAALTTANSKAIMDFATNAGLKYVLLDARWYGSEDARDGDATTARAPNLDVQEIVRYGKERNVGVILYVDRRQAEKQRDVLFPLYEKWGVAGVKLGFVNVGPQKDTAWITETIRKAAEHHLMLNIHDGYRATGNNRTWPNLLTVEGIRGNENMPAAEENCMLPFTRYVGGFGDYTVCYYNNRIKTTHAHQLAMSVISFSPLQCLFWYDLPTAYRNEPEVEFFKKVPTVWDDTKVINGEIGKFATIARRSRADWFVGTINGNESRTLRIPLAFLERGQKYTAHLFFDDDSVATRTKVGVKTRAVNSETILEVPFKAGGGQAMWISPASAESAMAKGFVHPGLLHIAADLERIKSNVAQGLEPWAGAWKAFTNRNQWLAPGYTPRPLEVVGRGVGSTGQANISSDCTAAYYNAVAWAVTGDERYARKSIGIMNAWSYKCKEINGKDAVLCAGIYGYKLANAAEIIRWTYKDWPAQDVDQMKSLLRDVFYPVVKDFATFANGNWDACAEAAMISFGVFLDDRAMFDRAARYFLAGSGDGSVLHYIINDTGQLQETGRDQGHAQLGIGLLSCAAEVAWNQGVDLYGAFDNRLLKGFEYTAKYNLGGDIPFVPTADRTGKYNHQRASERGKPDMAVYEIVFNHYANRLGIPAPFTSRAAAAYRPEPLAVDQVGAGTLLFSLQPYKAIATKTAPAIPGAVVATGSSNGISLSWPAAVGATSYTLKRASSLDGNYTLLARNIAKPSYKDSSAERGRVYYYIASAANSFGSSDDTLPVGACAGLPSPWTQKDVDASAIVGDAQFDGSTFTLEASGAGIGGSADQFFFVAGPLQGDGSITARYVPQTPSQFAKMGLMMRETDAADSPYVGLVITPEATSDIEVPHWHVELSVRSKSGANAVAAAKGAELDAPFATWGRLMAPFWLHLTRAGGSFTGSWSPDGVNWKPIGSTNVALKSELSAGLAGCSRIKVSTTIVFDNLMLSPASIEK